MHRTTISFVQPQPNSIQNKNNPIGCGTAPGNLVKATLVTITVKECVWNAWWLECDCDRTVCITFTGRGIESSRRQHWPRDGLVIGTTCLHVCLVFDNSNSTCKRKLLSPPPPCCTFKISITARRRGLLCYWISNVIVVIVISLQRNPTIPPP